jgi:flagellin
MGRGQRWPAKTGSLTNLATPDPELLTSGDALGSDDERQNKARWEARSLMTRINTNVQSLIGQRTLNKNNASLSTSLNRLSTGLRINAGKDDPAGLIASEMLRSRIQSTEQAIDNAVRADTVMAIAEGGLQEISSLLLEVESLVHQAANEAGLSHDEVVANQLQIDSILASIDRLAEATAFGDIKLLNGNLEFTTSGVNINEPTGAALNHLDLVRINAAKIPNGSYRQVTVNVVTGSEFAYVSARPGGYDGTRTSADTTLQIRGNYGTETLSFASGTVAADIVSAVNASTTLTGVSAVASGNGVPSSPTSILFSSTDYGLDAMVAVTMLQNPAALALPGGAAETDYGTNGTVTVNGANAIVDGLDVTVRSGSLSMDLRLDPTFGSVDSSSTSFEVTGGGATFAISPTLGLSGMETLGLTEVSVAKLGDSLNGYLSSLQSGLTNDLSSANFSTAQRIVQNAINQVSSLRGRIGAFQKNTLQTTINSLNVARENVTAAESAIRDADFAMETSQLTRAQILVQSSTAVLQIANTSPQNALQLLG